MTINASSSTASRSLGRMTRAMRAAAPSTTRALRVGVVSGGKMVDERVLHGHGAIVVGTSERCTVVVAGERAPSALKLLERTREGTRLRFSDAMRGRIVLPGGVTDLVGAARLAQRDAAGGWVIALGDDARGSIVVGDTTVLFQLVVAPPPAGRPELPLSVRPSFGETIDWPLATLAAISFLLHFGVVGSLYSDWADRILPLDGDARGIVESLPRHPSVPVDDETPREVDPSREHAEAPKKDATRREQRSPDVAPTNPRATLERDAARVFARIDADLRALGAFDPNKVATKGVLDDSSVPTDKLDRLARSDSAAGSSPYGLRIDSDRGPVAAGPRNLAEMGPSTADGETMRNTGERVVVAAPKPTMTDGVSPPVGGKVSGYDRVLRAARGRVRRCYDAGLSSNGDMEGRLSYVLTISASGAVSAARVAPSGSLSPTVVSCVEATLRGLAFDGPENGIAATITGSYGFVNSAKNR